MVSGQEPSATEPAAAPRIQLSSQEWNFGVAWQGQPLEEVIEVKNVGNAPLEILDVKSSCGCTVPTRPKSPLAPGASDVMKIKYDAAKRVGKANQTVTLVTNDPTQSNVVIKLLGEVKPAYEMDPKEGLLFGQLYQSSAEKRTVTIVNKYTDKFHLKLKEGQEFSGFDVQLEELEPGTKYTVTAVTRPPLKVDRFQADVVLLTDLQLIPEIRVPVYGFVQPPVSVRPTKLFLPQNSVSEMKRVLRVSHSPDHPIQITGVKASHEAIKVTLEQTTAGQLDTFQITVVLPPGDMIPEGVEPQIEITTNSSDPAYQKLVVPIQMVLPRPPQAAEGGAAQPSQIVPLRPEDISPTASRPAPPGQQ